MSRAVPGLKKTNLIKCHSPLLEDKSTISTRLKFYRSSRFGATTFRPLRVTYVSLMFSFAVSSCTCCSCAGIFGNVNGIVGWFDSASIGGFLALDFSLVCSVRHICVLLVLDCSLGCPGRYFCVQPTMPRCRADS